MNDDYVNPYRSVFDPKTGKWINPKTKKQPSDGKPLNYKDLPRKKDK